MSLSEANHPRNFRAFLYVYPVLSRRSGGVSIGINLNPDKACNFDCIYCQVDRSKKPQEYFVGLPKLKTELREALISLGPNGPWWQDPEFASLPPDRRRVTDVAFSGDGEPTTFKNFSQLIRSAIVLKEESGFHDAKVVLITNATGLDRPDVREGLRDMDGHRGEVWAKLDAGSAEYFKQIDNTEFPFERILTNITNCARERSVVIQSCFMRVRGIGPSPDEIRSFVDRLLEMKKQGGQIHLIQIYTVARDPAYGIVSSLSNPEIDRIAKEVAAATAIPTASFYGQVEENRGLMGTEPGPTAGGGGM